MSREVKIVLQSNNSGFEFVSGNCDELAKIDKGDEFVFKVECRGKADEASSIKTYLVRAMTNDIERQVTAESPVSAIKSHNFQFLEFIDRDDFVYLEEASDSDQCIKWFCKKLSQMPPKNTGAQKSDDVVKVGRELLKEVELQRHDNRLEVEQIRARTAGFSGGYNRCFANAALKQLLLEPRNKSIEILKLPESLQPLALAFEDLFDSFHKIRNNKDVPVIISKQSNAFFTKLKVFLSGNPVGLNSDDLLAYQNLKSLFGDFWQQEQDAREFSDSLCQLFRLNTPENMIFERKRFELTPPSQSLQVSCVQMQKPELGAFYMIYPNGKPLAEILSAETLVDEKSSTYVVQGEQTKTKNARLFNSSACASIDKVVSLRLCASVFAYPNIRKVKEGQALFIDNDDNVYVTFRKNLDIAEDQKESCTSTVVETASANFKIHTVVFHLGGSTVNSGHYITLENLGNEFWLIHNGLTITVYGGNMKKFVAQNNQCIPYLINLVKA